MLFIKIKSDQTFIIVPFHPTILRHDIQNIIITRILLLLKGGWTSYSSCWSPLLACLRTLRSCDCLKWKDTGAVFPCCCSHQGVTSPGQHETSKLLQSLEGCVLKAGMPAYVYVCPTHRLTKRGWVNISRRWVPCIAASYFPEAALKKPYLQRAL